MLTWSWADGCMKKDPFVSGLCYRVNISLPQRGSIWRRGLLSRDARCETIARRDTLETKQQKEAVQRRVPSGQIGASQIASVWLSECE